MPLDNFSSLCLKKQKEIVSRERGYSRKHIAYNKNGCYVSHYKVDGIIITQGDRCDYLLLNETAKRAYFIEIKGTDLTHAAEQLERTEKLLKEELKGYDYQFRIVSSRSKTQEIESSSFKKFRMRKAGALIYRTEVITDYL